MSTAREALRREWEEQMESAHDSLPPWYWSRPEREARRDAWVAARLAAMNPVSANERTTTP